MDNIKLAIAMVALCDYLNEQTDGKMAAKVVSELVDVAPFDLEPIYSRLWDAGEYLASYRKA